MLKTALIAAMVICISITQFGCSRSVASENYSIPPVQDTIQEEEDIEMDDNNNRNKYDDENNATEEDHYPGYFNPATLIDIVADWAEIEDGISITDNPVDLNAWFETDAAKENIAFYRSITLEDGSILGYAEYVKPQSVELDDRGWQVIVGDESDFTYDLVDKIAESMNLPSSADSFINYIYFIISNNEEKLDSYLSNSLEGARP